MRRSLCALVLLVLTGCVPATTPPQLAYTPGAPIAITGEQVQTSAFSVAYPAGWRVITSAAGQPPSVILVAPDDAAVITVGIVPALVPALANVQQPITGARTIFAPDRGLHIAWLADEARLPDFDATLAAVLASIRLI